MLTQELFTELIVDGIEFNGDIELKEDNTLVWSLNYEETNEEVDDVLDDEDIDDLETEDALDSLFESYEEDIDYIYELLDKYDIDYNDFEEADEFEFDGETLSLKLYVFEKETEKVEE